MTDAIESLKNQLIEAIDAARPESLQRALDDARAECAGLRGVLAGALERAQKAERELESALNSRARWRQECNKREGDLRELRARLVDASGNGPDGCPQCQSETSEHIRKFVEMFNRCEGCASKDAEIVDLTRKLTASQSALTKAMWELREARTNAFSECVEALEIIRADYVAISNAASCATTAADAWASAQGVIRCRDSVQFIGTLPAIEARGKAGE